MKRTKFSKDSLVYDQLEGRAREGKRGGKGTVYVTEPESRPHFRFG